VGANKQRKHRASNLAFAIAVACEKHEWATTGDD
jgi:hypothetical protein